MKSLLIISSLWQSETQHLQLYVRRLSRIEARLFCLAPSVLAAQVKKVLLFSYILGDLSVQLLGCTTKVSEICNNNQLILIYYRLYKVFFRRNHLLAWKPTLFSWCGPFCEDSLSHHAFTWISSGCFQTRREATNRCTSMDLSVSVGPARDRWPACHISPAATYPPTLNLPHKGDRWWKQQGSALLLQLCTARWRK